MSKVKVKRKIKYLRRLDLESGGKVFKFVVIILSFLLFLALLVYLLYQVCLDLALQK